VLVNAGPSMVDEWAWLPVSWQEDGVAKRVVSSVAVATCKWEARNSAELRPAIKLNELRARRPRGISSIASICLSIDQIICPDCKCPGARLCCALALVHERAGRH